MRQKFVYMDRCTWMYMKLKKSDCIIVSGHIKSILFALRCVYREAQQIENNDG